MNAGMLLAVVVLSGIIVPTGLARQETLPHPQTVILTEGTEVRLQMAQDVSSRGAKPGEPVELTLAEDLKVGDVIVAKAGERALGEIVQAKRPDFWGEAGEVSIRVRFLRVGNKKVEIRGAIGSAGTRYVFIRGSQGIIKTGTPLKAFVAADTEVVDTSEPSAERDVVRPGTEVEIELLEDISSETLRVGQSVPFKLVRALEGNGATLLPAGTTFTGTVTSANAAGHWGKAGTFDLRLAPLKLPDGTWVHIDFYRPAKLNERGEKTGEAVGSAIVAAGYFPLLPLALITGSRKGKPFEIRQGERYLVYVTGTGVGATVPVKP
jgi:hypothetical protein